MTDSRYGWYQYGRHSYDAPDRRDRTPPRHDDGPDPREVFGAGVALRTADDPGGAPWGFVADSSGDLAATDGYDEIAKDLAFSTAVDSSLLQGSLVTPADCAELEVEIERIAADDSRIDSVEVAVRHPGSRATPRPEPSGDPPETRPDTLLIDMTVMTVLGTERSETITVPIPRR